MFQYNYWYPSASLMPLDKVALDHLNSASSHNQVFTPRLPYKLEGAQLSAALKHNCRMGAEFRAKLYGRPDYVFSEGDSITRNWHEKVEARENRSSMGLGSTAPIANNTRLSLNQSKVEDANSVPLNSTDGQSILTRFTRAFAFQAKEENPRYEEVKTCGIDPKLVAPFNGTLDRTYLDKILVGNGLNNIPVSPIASNAGVQRE